jgi:hypothetical protein
MGALNFASTLIRGECRVNTANNDATGTGTLATLVAATSAPGFVYFLQAQGVTTTVAAQLRIFLVTAGGNRRLIRQIPVTAQTISDTGAGWAWEEALTEDRAIGLAAGDSLQVALTVAGQTIDVYSWGALQ